MIISLAIMHEMNLIHRGNFIAIHTIVIPFAWDNSEPLMLPHPDTPDPHVRQVWL